MMFRMEFTYTQECRGGSALSQVGLRVAWVLDVMYIHVYFRTFTNNDGYLWLLFYLLGMGWGLILVKSCKSRSVCLLLKELLFLLQAWFRNSTRSCL